MRVGVVGAGTMGAGIAEVFARTEGFEVTLTDASVELARTGAVRIAKSQDRLVAKGKIDAETAEATKAHVTVGGLDDLADADLVIEAIVESTAVKRPVLERLDGLCGPDAVFATNTSSLSVTELATGLEHPVVGMHFFNPAPVMKLVEVIAGAATPPDVVTRVSELATRLGKTPVVVNEAAGFVVNRILVPLVNEGVEVLAAGTASAQDIDTAMKLGANHPMGPLELGDLIGLDVVLAIMEVLQAETGDPKYRPHPLLRKYVRAGWLGRKSGRGFYPY
ncbi:MAG: 3-hydroxybutyryl-CoA dehydrogenase [Actinomycetales bacterium]|nr:3-hydroxybutyryl-CoA dehydrogenase [Actinomycetales bacterium]